MPHSLVELQLPPEIYARAQTIALETNRSIEAVLLDSLALLLGDNTPSTISLEALQTYGDEQLWALVHRHLALSEDLRLRALVAEEKKQALTTDEQHELDDLLALVDHYMLLRSKALALLQERGHEIKNFLTIF